MVSEVVRAGWGDHERVWGTIKLFGVSGAFGAGEHGGRVLKEGFIDALELRESTGG